MEYVILGSVMQAHFRQQTLGRGAINGQYIADYSSFNFNF